MNLINLIRRLRKQEQPSKEREIKILLRTNQQGHVEVVDAVTDEVLKGINRVRFYVNILKKPVIEIEFKNVQLDLEIEDVIIRDGKRDKDSQ